MTQCSDNEIIQQVLEGQINCFELLVKKYEARLFVFVGNLIQNRQLTEDLVQDVFLSAFTHLPSFKSEKSKFSTWLYRIARNACFNAMKKKKEVTMETLPEQATTRNAQSPSDTLLLRESFQQLDKALAGLDKKERSVFVLFAMNGLSYEEIAGIENIKTGTLKSRLFRAKQKIRESLNAYLKGDSEETV